MRSVDVVTGYLQAFAGGDPDRIASFVAEGFHNEHLSALGSGCVGQDEYRRRLPHFLASFADRSYEVVDVVEQRRESVDVVVAKYRLLATYEGTRIEVPGVMWFHVRDGAITRRTDVWDSLTFLEQTGQAPD